MIDFTGKTVWVTGAARGIGRATAIAFAEAGASVIVSDIARQVGGLTYETATRDDLDETVALVAGASGSRGRVVPVICDVRDREACSRAVAIGLERFGRLDAVVANAGIASWPASTWQASPEQWQTMIDVVLTGTWTTLSVAIPAILAGGRGGALAVVGSTAAVKSLATSGHYSAAKRGLVGLVKSLALELAPDRVRVNIVHPGGTGTVMTENPAAEQWQRSTQAGGNLDLPLPIHRMEPVDVAVALRWLCSAEARYITGAELVVDAGATLK